jgi:predicted dehydrogenase
MFKLGFVGAGFIAKFQALALTMVRNVELAGVCAKEGAEELATWARGNGLGDCRVYATVAELCNCCDAVAIFVPNMFRVEVMSQIAAAKAGGAEIVGVLCEKPLGRTVAEATQMVQLAKDGQLFTAYLENQIHMKAIQRALAQLAPQAAEMGPLYLVRSKEEHSGPHMPWFWDPTRQGGGVLSDMSCHSLAVIEYCLTPPGEPTGFLEPVSITAQTKLLKWGQPKYRQHLLMRMGVDYTKIPAEDFATGVVTFRNPKTGQLVTGQFTNSWCFDKQGLLLYMDGLGPDYAFEVDTLRSPLQLFIGDQAACAVADKEGALEKATASRGLLPVPYNEADMYGYVDELDDAVRSFQVGRDARLNFHFGAIITWLCQAAYLSAEEGRELDLTDPGVRDRLRTYQSEISLGIGHRVLGMSA